MKVLHVLDTVAPSSGGPIEAVRREAAELRQHSIDAEFVTLDQPEEMKSVELGFPLHVLGNDTSRLWSWLGPAYRYCPTLVPWLQECASRYDWVIAHGIWSYNTLGVAQALRHTKTPYLVFAHGMLDPWFRDQYPLKHLKKQVYWTLAVGAALRDADRVLFTAEDELTRAKCSFWGYDDYKAQIVDMGTADVPADVPQQRAAFCALMPALAGRRYLLFLGRIHPKKGCDLLIQAFADIAGVSPDMDLVIAGPDSTGWRSQLEELATKFGLSGRVHWPGMLAGDAKWGAFRAAEAFVLPSHQENFGIAVAEAMACGLPVLITDRINIWREVQAAGAGLVEADNLAGTRALLRHFLALDDTARVAMRRSARIAFEQKFDVRRTSESMLSLLRRS